MKSVWFFIVFLLLYFLVYIDAQIFEDSDYLSDPFYPPASDPNLDYPLVTKPEVVQQQSGVNINLKCNATICHHKHHSKIVWEFKACQPDFKYVSCSKYYESVRNVHAGENGGWTKIEGNVSKKKCSHVLELRNTTGNQSGIYRCIEHGKVLKSYEVEITDFTKYSGMPPELLDVIPSNVTVQQNSQVIIQCKVYSQQPPVILWFKQSDITNYDIQYFDKFYIRINTTVQVYPVPHEVNVYMSKLNIHDTREIDSGLYVCVAMTEHGKDLKHATVKVISSTTNWEPHTSFSLLFLIPLIFALIPVTVWLCYYRKKMKNDSRNPLQIQQERKLIRPVLATNGQNHMARSSVI